MAEARGAFLRDRPSIWLARSLRLSDRFDARVPSVIWITVAAGLASEVELEFWRSIKDSNKPEELNAYLTNYPNGTFKSIALAASQRCRTARRPRRSRRKPIDT